MAQVCELSIIIASNLRVCTRTGLLSYCAVEEQGSNVFENVYSWEQLLAFASSRRMALSPSHRPPSHMRGLPLFSRLDVHFCNCAAGMMQASAF